MMFLVLITESPAEPGRVCSVKPIDGEKYARLSLARERILAIADRIAVACCDSRRIARKKTSERRAGDVHGAGRREMAARNLPLFARPMAHGAIACLMIAQTEAIRSSSSSAPLESRDGWLDGRQSLINIQRVE